MKNPYTHHERAEIRRINGIGDPRKTKRYENKKFLPVYIAWCEGEAAADGNGYPVNPYPPGLRHTMWQRAFDMIRSPSEPMDEEIAPCR